jgi:Holliday junction resolvase-like predicted endonuclease
MARFDFLKWRRGSAAAAGRLGEAAAERFLWWRGYRIIDRNYSNDQGEIDLIAERNGVKRRFLAKTQRTRRREERKEEGNKGASRWHI